MAWQFTKDTYTGNVKLSQTFSFLLFFSFRCSLNDNRLVEKRRRKEGGHVTGPRVQQLGPISVEERWRADGDEPLLKGEKTLRVLLFLKARGISFLVSFQTPNFYPFRFIDLALGICWFFFSPCFGVFFVFTSDYKSELFRSNRFKNWTRAPTKREDWKKLVQLFRPSRNSSRRGGSVCSRR